MKPRRFPHPSLRAQIITWSFVPTAAILLLVALSMYYAYQKITEDFAIQRDVELTRLSAGEISTGFEQYVDRLWTLSRLHDIQQGSPEEQRQALARSQNRLIYFDAGVYLVNNLGVVVGALPDQPGWIGQDWSNRPYFHELVRSKEPFFSSATEDGPGGSQVIVAAVPVLGENDEFKGVALGMFRLDVYAVSPFFGTILKLNIGRSGNAYIMDGNSRLIYAANFDQIGEDFSSHPVASGALAGQIGAVRVRAPDGRDTVASYAPVPRTGWSLIVEENWSDLVRPIQGYGRFLVVLLGLGIVLPTIVVMIGVRRITGPVNDFIAAAKRIASGDFNQSIAVQSGDELEELARQFNDMAAQLRESYANLERRVSERTAELSAVNSIAEVVSRSLDLNQILPDALSKTIEVLRMDGGVVYRLDTEAQVLTPVVEQGMREPLRSLTANMPLEASVAHVVAQTKHPVARWVSDYPPGAVRSALEAIGAIQVISIPLLAQEKVLGAINMYRCSAQETSAEELSVASAVGQQIGVAMDNARLYAQSVEYARSMAAARQVAEQANASKSAFVANVSHELRTPLTSILGFTRIVQKRLQERILPLTDSRDPRVARAIQQVQDNLEIILSEGERLTALINHVLDLEKIEAGKMDWRMEPVEMNEVINQACAATIALFEDNGLELVRDIPAGLPQVVGDRDQLIQVVINLISNAAKFTRQGRVTVRAQVCKGQGRPPESASGEHSAGHSIQEEVIISVSDTGIGIAPDDLPKVFEKFQQVGDTLTDKPKGTGLGLTISKEIVEHYGGRIWAESRLGQGSTFSFALPALSAVVTQWAPTI